MAGRNTLMSLLPRFVTNVLCCPMEMVLHVAHTKH